MTFPLDPRVRTFFRRIPDGPELWTLPPDQAQLYFNFTYADAKARFLLLRLCEVAPTAAGVLVLYGAMKYLENRDSYISQDWTAEVFGIRVDVARGNCHGRRRRGQLLEGNPAVNL
ncbi:MAG: hypothetical protein JWN34_38 [Bryobacterales bacterium]|nr:hypothetical protein [Bryobacterales bacterium]